MNGPMGEAYDVITVGGGLAGSALARTLAQRGIRVLVLEREVGFRDRVRGEQMHCWGVVEARALGLYDLLMESCGHEVRYWSSQFVGFTEVRQRDLVETTPNRTAGLNLYHPCMQSVLIEAAARAGATVRRGVRVVGLVSDGAPGVRVHEDGNERVYRARLLVGADGRNSVCRRWGGFKIQRDPAAMDIAGLLMTGLGAPADRVSVFANPRRSMLSLTAPLGKGRFRAYVGTHRNAKEAAARPLSSQAGIADFIAASIAAGAPKTWYGNGARVAGPLATFDAADSWVAHPHRAGIVLIGDAAASNDPCFGCGLSLTLRDVRVLADRLLASNQWSAAADAYADEHDRHYGAIHRLTGWARELLYDPDPAAAAKREIALPQLAADRGRALDIVGIGPEFPTDDATRRRFFGED